jgi:hypothetical protein
MIRAALFLFLACLLPLTACGKKPSDVVLSDDGAQGGYPGTYPDPANDPEGVYKP